MIEGTSAESLFETGERKFRTEDYPGAIEALEKALARDPTNAEGAYYLGLAYANINEPEKALELLDRFVDKLGDPMREIQIHFLIGYLYTVREMYELAELEYVWLLRNNVRNAQVYSALAFICHKRKQYAEALRNLREALAIDPTNANAKNSLGFVMIEAGENLDDAIRHIRDALESDPENAAYFDSLGWAYFKKGDYANARRYLLKAFELAPNVEEIKSHVREVQRMTR